MPSHPAVDEPVRFDTPDGERKCRRRRVLYAVFTVVVVGIVGSTIVEGASGAPLYGVDTARAAASAGGVRLEVRYPRVTRGQLDTPMHVIVRRADGFDGPVTIEMSSSYLALFVTDDISPQPTSESTHGDRLSMTFDPPTGDTLEVDLDLAAKPRGWFQSEEGTVAVVADSTLPDISVTVRTDVRP